MKAGMIIPLLHIDFSLDGYVCSMTKGPKAGITQTGKPLAMGPLTIIQETKQKTK